MSKEQRTISNKRHSWFSVFCFLFSVFCLILPIFSLAQNQLAEPPATLLAETPFHLALRADVPHSAEEAKELGEKTLEVSKEEMPGILERIWKEEVLSLWQKMWDWFKNFWEDTLWPWIKGLWESRIKPPVEEEVEKRKEIAKESIEKEKE